MTKIEVSIFKEVTRLPIWGAKSGYGSFLSFEFGPEVYREKAATQGKREGHGEWHFWIYNSTWKIQKGNFIFLHSESEKIIIKNKIGDLNGLFLMSVTFDRENRETVISTNSDFSIYIFPNDPPDQEDEWILFHLESTYFMDGNGYLCCEKSDTRTDAAFKP